MRGGGSLRECVYAKKQARAQSVGSTYEMIAYLAHFRACCLVQNYEYCVVCVMSKVSIVPQHLRKIFSKIFQFIVGLNTASLQTLVSTK